MNEQINDILSTKGNILIQASAGTGKTTTLMYKIEQLLKQGSENLLILTFSNAGVNEIKKRIKESGLFLGNTLVSTFHSFCLTIIKENLPLIGFRVQPRILDETTSDFEKIKSVKRTISELEKTTEKNLFQSVMAYSSSGFNKTSEEFFVELYNKVFSLENPARWLSMATEKYSAVQPAFIYDEIKLICEVLIKTDEYYSSFKKKNNYIDFLDMEKFALQILYNPSITELYKEKYKYILVDEYQDTSILQEKILSLLEENNLFCVGDLKQSIYGFRNATPKILENRYNLYNSSANGANKYLTYNYRSSENIVNFINDMFSSYKDDEGFFSDEAKLIYGRNIQDVGNLPVEIHTFSGDLDAKLENTEEIIKIIKSLVGQNIFVSSENRVRPCKYSDIQVLTPKLATYKTVLCEQFQKNLIPYTISQKINLLAEPEIKTLLSLFRLFTYHADLDFIHFFHKGFCGFNDNDIAELKNSDFKKSFYDHLIESQNIRYSGLKTLFLQEESLDFFTQAENIINHTKFFDFLKKNSSPEITEQNAIEFIYWMSTIQQSNPHWQMTDFLFYIDDLNNNKIQVKGPSVPFEDAVEISTIHSVKGQDASIVILAFTENSSTPTNPTVSFDPELGIGIKFFDIEQKVKKDSPIKQEIDSKLSFQEKAEDFRLLYVALTRARDRLFIIGKSDAKNVQNSFLGFILKVLNNKTDVKSNFSIIST